MQKVIALILGLSVMGWGAIGSLTIPHEIDSAAIPKVIYIDQNNDSIINRVNEIKDTVNGLAAGTAAFSGLTASRLMSTNASKQPASVSDLTSWIAGTANQITSTSDGDGTLTLSLPSAVTFPGTVAVTGIQSNSEALAFVANGSSGDGRIWKSSGSGMSIRGIAGSSYDLRLFNAGGNAILQNPTGTQSLEFAGTGSNTFTGKVIGSDTIAASLGFRAGSAGATDAQLYRSGANMWTTPDSLTVAGRVAVTGAAAFGSTIATPLTASRTVITDGSGNLSVNTETGTGSHVRATSPTLVTPTLGVAAATSIALGGNEAFTYDEGTFVATFTGFTTAVTGTARFVRAGKSVTIFIPAVNGTSNTTGLTMTGAPASIMPARQNCVVIETILDNNLNYSGYAAVDVSGVITFFRRTSATGDPTATFTSSGTKGFGQDMTITYSLL